MSRVAIATCLGTDVDRDSPVLLGALANIGVKGELAVWDDPSVAWDRFEIVVIRSTWDYAARRNEFLAWARSVKHLFNPYGVVEYSSDKHYLVDLEAHGLKIIPSHFCDVGKKPRFFHGDFVVKPCVGAGSMDAVRFKESEHDLALAHVASLHASGRDALIQPYVASVDTAGERALIFIDGALSHAMTKGAMLNVTQLDRNQLFRLDQMSRADAEPDAVAFAQSVLSAKAFSHLLYARVDLVRLDDRWAVMELELVEPSLFLTYDEGAAVRLAGAIARRLA
ncbi:MAG TPA: hypothetical protein VNF08_04850 [Acidimicrobiales bacterium]|nr:hypothetical protein [Acidimicrobiales bacterium]